MENRIRFYTLPQTAESFLVSCSTVRRWIHDGLLIPRYQVRSGSSCRLVFLENDLLAFMDHHFPSKKDLEANRSLKAHHIRKLQRMARLYAGRATAARVAKKYGFTEEEMEDRCEENTEESEPVVLDHKPRAIGGTRE